MPQSPADSTTAERIKARAYCSAVLPRVSRTFALNIRLLPGDLGDAVRCAYLFCRIADTLEDSPHFTAAERVALLADYRTLFPLREGWRARAGAWAAPLAPLAVHGSDHELCARTLDVFVAFATLKTDWRQPVEDCLREMTHGMGTFAERRAAAPDGRLQLETLAELETYCHYVAGTVGHMLCRLFLVSMPGLDAGRREPMARLAERFGLAMQLTNIVKDVAEDATRGAIFVPRSVAARHRLDPGQLLEPEHRPAAQATLGELVAHALSALDAALAFTLLIPRRAPRLRLFCLWPIFLAARTLDRVLHDDRVLVPGARVRIMRAEVRRCLASTTLVVWSDAGIRWLYGRSRPRLDGVGPAM
jgi:farnesyl-diphosphate farnesyltransferase